CGWAKCGTRTDAGGGGWGEESRAVLAFQNLSRFNTYSLKKSSVFVIVTPEGVLQE
ncbi:MAG: hypothetical protein UV04_C0035G0001, partial [Candidatus Gottesmanbacteria bacterium GW2011_GWA2_42_16]